jgi:hypothetical protein
VILNPLDERCPTWSPWAELRSENFRMDDEVLAQSLIPDAANSFTKERGGPLLPALRPHDTGQHP